MKYLMKVLLFYKYSPYNSAVPTKAAVITVDQRPLANLQRASKKFSMTVFGVY